MKYFVKVFSIAFLCFVLAVSAGIFTYVKLYSAEADDKGSVVATDKKHKEDETDIEKITDPLQKAIINSKRINFLLLGMEETRTDTIMFASFDTKSKAVDIISIPRDTYYYMPKYNKRADDRKINAVYGKKGKGIEGTIKAVEEILGGVPIHHYVMIDYEGIEKIVDSLGGVEVTVPLHMKYKDTTVGRPPLYIDIPKGKQVLNGENSVKFLRYRKNSDGTGYPDGDLGRIRAQQQFVSSAIKKSLSLKLPNVIKTCFNYVKTDVGMSDALRLAANSLGLDMENINMTTLPGITDYKTINGTTLSYFNHDSAKIKVLMMELYNVKGEENNKN